MFTTCKSNKCGYKLLLPISLLCFSCPFLFEEYFLNFVAVPIFYFFGSYFIFLNFSFISEFFNTQPLYVNDLMDKIEESGIQILKFRKIYNICMNLMLALTVAGVSEYTLISENFANKSIIEILGIIGGNLMIYMKLQNVIGSVTLNICNCIKKKQYKKCCCCCHKNLKESPNEAGVNYPDQSKIGAG